LSFEKALKTEVWILVIQYTFDLTTRFKQPKECFWL